ncbi:hypothetical protein CI610_03750 [invertebrate metagenome]|uniref:Uncharacterized protein n=1 Tax=invertebrate metagenome TaxID=1711999 RepID=A0A2H9T289_9ZZZZ
MFYSFIILSFKDILLSTNFTIYKFVLFDNVFVWILTHNVMDMISLISDFSCVIFLFYIANHIEIVLTPFQYFQFVR